MNIITTKNLIKVYQQGEEKIYAVKDVNISIKKGEMIAIVESLDQVKLRYLICVGGLISQAWAVYF